MIFLIFTPVFKYYRSVGAICSTSRLARIVSDAKIAFCNGLSVVLFVDHDTAVRAGKNAGITADAAVGVDRNNAVFHRKSACYAALYAWVFRAVTALDGKIYAVALFHGNARNGRSVQLECLCHVGFAAVGKSAVIFAKMAA